MEHITMEEKERELVLLTLIYYTVVSLLTQSD
jgi:hypothetical protein